MSSCSDKHQDPAEGRNKHPIDLTQDEESQPEAMQTLPSHKIIELERALRQKDIRDFNLEDFTLAESSDGTSLLVSRLIDMITSIHTDLTPFQIARLAAHAIVHHPLRLLEYLTNTPALNSFVMSALQHYPVDTSDQYNLSPIDTPYLVIDDSLCMRMEHRPNHMLLPSSRIRDDEAYSSDDSRQTGINHTAKGSFS